VSVVGLHAVVGLHPEELIDRERRGELSEHERDRLEGHRAHCSACRIERQMHADFALELDSDVEVPIPNLAGILPRPSQAPTYRSEVAAPPAAAPVPALRAGRSRRVRTIWMLAAAALVVVSAAAGAGVRGRTWLRLMTSTFVPEREPVAVAAPTEPATPKPSRVAHPAPAPPETAQPEALQMDTPVAEVVSTHLTPSPVAPSPAVVLVRAVLSTDGAPRPAAPAVLFDSERSARLRGDYARVLSLHHELVLRYPQSREAQVSRATVGQLLLDRGDPAAALDSFDAYLSAVSGVSAGTGQLAELALVGRATALDRLGRGGEALSAWRALIVAFPDTPYARHAAARLGAGLGAGKSGDADRTEGTGGPGER
jgi:hypothetical protein